MAAELGGPWGGTAWSACAPMLWDEPLGAEVTPLSQPCPPQEIIVMAMKGLWSQARGQGLPLISSSSSLPYGVAGTGGNVGAPGHSRWATDFRNDSPRCPSSSGLDSPILQKTEAQGSLAAWRGGWEGGDPRERLGRRGRNKEAWVLTQGMEGCPWRSPQGNLVLGI